MKLFGDRSAADNRAALEHGDLQARRGEIGGGDETIMAAADDDDVRH